MIIIPFDGPFPPGSETDDCLRWLFHRSTGQLIEYLDVVCFSMARWVPSIGDGCALYVSPAEIFELAPDMFREGNGGHNLKREENRLTYDHIFHTAPFYADKNPFQEHPPAFSKREFTHARHAHPQTAGFAAG